MNANTANKVLVITGAAGGIGQAFAVHMAKRGYHVAIADIADTHETVKLVQAVGRAAYAEHCDLSSPEAIRQFADNVLARFGRCDVLVNNAVYQPIYAFEDIPLTEWRKIQAVNVDAPFLLCQALLPTMRAQKFGRIINIASSSAWSPNPGFTAYITSKMGIVGFTRGLAKEVGNDGITVNAIAPGLTKTAAAAKDIPEFIFDAVRKQQLIQRTGEADDLCGALAFLASDDASFITGQTYHVDGGAVL